LPEGVISIKLPPIGAIFEIAPFDPQNTKTLF
jgi:hypothetical protein